jgi:hypothetical protein
MRRPDRIEPFLGILGNIWKNNPELRFGQLISLAFGLFSGQTYDGRLWHVEDDDFLERLMENMSISRDNLTKPEIEQRLAELKEPIRGEIMDLAIFEGEDWRLK